MKIGEVIKTNKGCGYLIGSWGIYLKVVLISEDYTGYFHEGVCSELTLLEKELF